MAGRVPCFVVLDSGHATGFVTLVVKSQQTTRMAKAEPRVPVIITSRRTRVLLYAGGFAI